jgi:Pyridoxamine 5'-phosphate oxidase
MPDYRGGWVHFAGQGETGVTKFVGAEILLEFRRSRRTLREARMSEPTASRPHWPDALQNPPDATSGLKPWAWAAERLEKSHNYWISTTRPDGRPHLMVVWGVWWENAFWFSTGPRTRKAKNIAANPQCVIGTEKADEAVIVEGIAQEIEDRAVWKQIAESYDRKYGGDLLPLLESSGGSIFRVQPRVAFGQDEHAANFVESATRWQFAGKQPGDLPGAVRSS